MKIGQTALAICELVRVHENFVEIDDRQTVASPKKSSTLAPCQRARVGFAYRPPSKMISKVDLHVHSRFSNRSRSGCSGGSNVPDSYTDRRKLHALLRERGMDFVTITDHDRIDGCLELPVCRASSSRSRLPHGFRKIAARSTSSSGASPRRSTAKFSASARTFTTSRNI